MQKIRLTESQFQNLLKETVKNVLKEARAIHSTGYTYVTLDEIDGEIELDFEYTLHPGYPGTYYEQPEPARAEIGTITVSNSNDFTPEELSFIQTQIDNGEFDEQCEDAVYEKLEDSYYDSDPYGGDGWDD